jgi:hypothetical protein
MKKASAIVSFALAASSLLTGTASLAQPDADEAFRHEDRRAIKSYSCSKDGALMEGVFFVTPSFSDMKRLEGKTISWDVLTPEINKAASGITSAFTVQELLGDPATNQVIDEKVAAFQDAVEKKSEISLHVDELNFSPIDPAEVEPAKRYRLPKCSGGNGGGMPPGRGSSPPGFGI